MNIFSWIAAIIFFQELPNPLFWLMVHPQIGYWRGRLRAAYLTALLVPWSLVTIGLIVFRHAIFVQTRPGDLRIGFGLLFIAADIWLFSRAQHDLGRSRFVGKAELCGEGQVITEGVYSHLRNPRYVGMIGGVLGACLLAATPLMWAIAAVWLPLVLIVIAFEERELKARLGAPYIDYCRRVPRFIPHRIPRRSIARAK